MRSEAIRNFVLTTLLSVVMIFAVSAGSGALCEIFPALKPEHNYIAQYPFILSLIIFAVLPAVYEELIFRGVVLGALRKRVPDLWAVFISSLLFAAAHWGILQGAAAFVWGVFLAVLLLKTRSLIFCVYAHLLNNLAFLIIK